jgi:hypothetical protein
MAIYMNRWLGGTPHDLYANAHGLVMSNTEGIRLGFGLDESPKFGDFDSVQLGE